MRLHFFDMKSGKYEDMNVIDVLEERYKWNLKDIQETLGLVVEIKGLKNPEEFIHYYYKNKGYNVIKLKCGCNYGGGFTIGEKYAKFDGVVLSLLSKYEPSKRKIKQDLNVIGVPDFLVWNKNEVFFVEAKSWNDGIKARQLIWMFSHNYPIKVFIQSENEIENRVVKEYEEEDLRID